MNSRGSRECRTENLTIHNSFRNFGHCPNRSFKELFNACVLLHLRFQPQTFLFIYPSSSDAHHRGGTQPWPLSRMKLTTAAVSAAAAVYLVFCVFYSAKVIHSSAAAPPPLMSHRSIRPLGVIAAAVERTRGADAVMATTSSSDSRLSVPNIPQQAGQKPDAAAIASWCARMQREGDAIARSFDGETS
jgi:hypothetical protein